MGGRGNAGRLVGRRRECAALARLVEAVRASESRALVVRGEPGVGKTVLLDYVTGQARGCRVARVAGVQSEMELAFAGLHQLCTPMLDHLERIPVPQQDAMRTAFGLAAGPPPDRFLVGLGVLSLLSEVAGDRPLVCLVDDEQWLDRASAQALGFTARRLGADPVGLVFAAREPGQELAGLPVLDVDGLSEPDARALLDSALAGPLDERVRDLIVAETRGNPLALLELPRGLSLAELAGGFGLLGARPAAGPLTDRIEASFTRQLETLPADTRRLLQLAAADPSGDRPLVWRAAGRLGISTRAAAPALEAGLVEFGTGIRFRHPLLRSVAYRSAAMADRQQLHAALAGVTDPATDPDRRAWHRAQASAGTDEEVAVELERSAGRAQARGGLAAAAAFLERAVALTVDPARRAGRTLAAAQASVQAGAFGKALDLVTVAEAGPLDESQGARADWLRGQIAFASGPCGDAPLLLLKAAKRLEPLSLDLARQTYVDAWQAGVFAGYLAGAGGLLEVSCAARALPQSPHPPRPVDLLLDGLTLMVTDGPAAAAPVLRQATSAFASADIPIQESLQWGWLVRVADRARWGEEGRRLTVRQVELAREVGSLDQLPILLNMTAMDAVWSGDFAAAASLIAEADAVCEATGARLAPYAAMRLAALRGNQAEAVRLIQPIIEQATAGGQGLAVTVAHRAAAILCNGLGRYEEALAAAREASEHKHVLVSVWALPELIEAAVRTGNPGMAGEAVDRLTETARAGGTEHGLGIEARSRALLSEGETAEGYYREANSRLGHSRRRPELARAHLLYGEWLRGERRRSEARDELRTALEMFEAMGMEAFAGRARAELRATGERARPRGPGAPEVLTPQEAQIARLVAEHLSNREIAARLFISASTVEYHLRKIFRKLGVTSRTQFARTIQNPEETPAWPD